MRSGRFMRQLALRVGVVLILVVGVATPSPSVAGSPMADLAASVTGAPDPAPAGGVVTFNVRVRNDGAVAADGVRVRFDRLGGAFVAFGPAPGFSCTGPRSVRGRRILAACVGARISAGGQTSIVVRVRVGGAAGSYTQAVTVDPANAVAEVDEADNSASGAVVVAADGIPDLTARLTGSPIPARFGDPIAWTGTVSNRGIWTAHLVTFRLDFPASVIDPTVAGPAGFACAVAASSVTCTGGDVPVGMLSPIVLSGIAPDATVGLTATLTVDPDGLIDELDEGNDAATALIPVTDQLPDLTVAFEAGPVVVSPSGGIVHTLTVRNIGNTRADAVVLRMPALAGTFASAAGSNGFVCKGPTKAWFRHPARPLTCSGGGIAAGGHATIGVDLVAPETQGTTSSTAQVATGDGTRQLDTSNDKAAIDVLTTGNGIPDLTVQLTGSPDPAAIGEVVTWQVVIGNSGTGRASYPVVEVVLPDGSTYVSTTGIGASCAADGLVVTCSLVTIARAKSVTFGILASAPALAGTAIAHLSVDPAGLIVESDEADNATTAQVAVTSDLPDLTVEAETSAPSMALSGDLTLTLVVSNPGNATASGVAVTAWMPLMGGIAGFPSTGGFSCAEQDHVEGRKAVCTGGSIAAGASRTIEVLMTEPLSAGHQVITISVDPGAAIKELSESNNDATVGLDVTP